ncbi:MAG: helix-turn-helix domain-containing protein [Pirellulaceae bacterium]
MGNSSDPKESILREHGLWNPNASEVTDPLFQQSEFFDPRDLLLVKYEMLRRVRVEGTAVESTARAFGFSRSGFYKVLTAWQERGLAGLLPLTPGPRGPHKLTDEVLQQIDRFRETDSRLSISAIVKRLRKELRLRVHARSVERALERRKKRGR